MILQPSRTKRRRGASSGWAVGGWSPARRASIAASSLVTRCLLTYLGGRGRLSRGDAMERESVVSARVERTPPAARSCWEVRRERSSPPGGVAARTEASVCEASGWSAAARRPSARQPARAAERAEARTPRPPHRTAAAGRNRHASTVEPGADSRAGSASAAVPRPSGRQAMRAGGRPVGGRRRRRPWGDRPARRWRRGQGPRRVASRSAGVDGSGLRVVTAGAGCGRVVGAARGGPAAVAEDGVGRAWPAGGEVGAARSGAGVAGAVRLGLRAV